MSDEGSRTPPPDGVQPASLAVEAALVRQHGQTTLSALHEIVRLCEVGARLVDRGRPWFDGDPDNVPGLAAEAIVIKIGENVSRLAPAFQDDHPQVPWRVIKAMRNRLTHYYEATDYDVVWQTLAANLPQVRSMVLDSLGRPEAQRAT